MGFHKPDIKHILLATDLSENAERAFGYAASLADACDASVTVLHVLEEIPPKAELMVMLFEGLEREAEIRKRDEAEILGRVERFVERYCDAFKERFPACRLFVKSVVVEKGDPVKRILRNAYRDGYDVLVMGARGFGFVRGILMGSTSQAVVRQCRIPVLVVPPEAEAANENAIV